MFMFYSIVHAIVAFQCFAVTVRILMFHEQNTNETKVEVVTILFAFTLVVYAVGACVASVAFILSF